jgi:predicted aspartyl protease
MAWGKPFLSGIFLCALLPFAAQADDSPVCKLTRVANIDMTFDAAGRPAIPVTLNGVTKQFFIDTAGIYSAVSEETAVELNIKQVSLFRSAMLSLDGTAVTKMARPDTMAIGKLNLPKGVALAVRPAGHSGSDVAGSLSPDILQFFDVEFDFATGKFELFLQSDCGETVVHWTNGPYSILPFEMDKELSSLNLIKLGKDWHIIARGQLDGVDVDVNVDTGSSTQFMTLEDAKSVMPRGTDTDKLQRSGEVMGAEAYSYPFKTLKLGDVTVNNPRVVIQKNRLGMVANLGKTRPQLILGASVLRQLHFYISYKNKKIYLTEASAH